MKPARTANPSAAPTGPPAASHHVGKSQLRPLHERKLRLLEAEEEARNPTPPSPELLALLAALRDGFGEDLDAIFDDLGADISDMPATRTPATCGARTRSGAPCRALGLASGRCKNHGGMSTGPKTAAGRARTAAGYRRWLEEKRRAAGTPA